MESFFREKNNEQKNDYFCMISLYLYISQSVSHSVSQTISLSIFFSLLVISYLFHQFQEYAYVCMLLLLLFFIPQHRCAAYASSIFEGVIFFCSAGRKTGWCPAHTRARTHTHNIQWRCYFVCSFAKWYKTNTIMLIKKNSYALSSLFNKKAKNKMDQVPTEVEVKKQKL